MAIIDINNATRVIKTAAEWAVDSATYDSGKWLITSDEFFGSTDQQKIKIANGSDTWSNLDYMPIGEGSGGQVDSVVGTSQEIDVDNTDSENPILSLASEVSLSLGLADSAIQSDDLGAVATSNDYDDLDNKPDISGIATNTSAISTLDGEVVKKADYTPAHSILVQQSGTGTPESLNVGTSTIVGRVAGAMSEIDDLSPTQVRSLLNVEDGADVTDTDNVTSAGALMDSEVTNLDQVKAFDSSDYATAAQGVLADSALQSSDTITDYISGLIEVPADKDYKLVVKSPYACTITETTTISTVGTCTATFKINTTALGGTANSVSTSEQSQAHSSANSASAGDDIVLTISSNSSCENMSFTIKFTRTLA